MTEITEIHNQIRYSVHPTAFVAALICAPLAVTALTFWTVLGLFALPFGILPYLVIGTPLLLWAVGHIKPRFGAYALLGLAGNFIMAAVIGIVTLANGNIDQANEAIVFFAGFGMIFAPLYGGTFGSLYASFHPNIRILRT
ncbi:hypothetical protein BC777_1900 [Yoonia maricola]|uniref:Uncharacterized protein n=1 Tax=Yoonia maricola TaxID=420999 RepID=A0A2M8WQ25_9RHOB|nr:hypothetical protein [Yoonia maricola]PJI93033.1 hypothetical protein BC777_1900 [Yoonia maricola]